MSRSGSIQAGCASIQLPLLEPRHGVGVEVVAGERFRVVRALIDKVKFGDAWTRFSSDGPPLRIHHHRARILTPYAEMAKRGSQRRKQSVADKAAVKKPNEVTPKSMVIRMGAGEIGSSVSQLVQDVRQMMQPDTAVRLKERRANKLRDVRPSALEGSHKDRI
jgi:hypothetical protein